MFYKVCLGLAIGIVALSLIGSFTSASSLTLRKEDSVTPAARSRLRSTYIVPVPAGYSSSGGSGSSRSNYDGYRGGGPGTGK